MRKRWWVAGGVALLLGMGAGTAQWWSSQAGERALVRLTERLDAQPGWQASRHEVEHGWRHSSGVLRLAAEVPAGHAPFDIVLPYRMRHGLLGTRLDGEIELPRMDELRWQASEAPTWHATYRTPTREMTGRLVWPTATLRGEAASQARLGAGELTLSGHVGDVRYHLHSAPSRLTRENGGILSGELDVQGRFRGDARRFHHTLSLSLAELRLLGGAPFALENVSHEADIRLDDDALHYRGEGRVGSVVVGGEQVASGRLALSLTDVDGEAVRTLIAHMRDQAVASAENDTVAPGTVDWERLTPVLVALLQDSPRLILSSLQVSSEAFGVDSRAHGEMMLDGDDLAPLAARSVTTPAFWRHLQRRVNGRVTLRDAPPLLSLYLGLSPDTSRLEFRVSQGEWQVNGQALRW